MVIGEKIECGVEQLLSYNGKTTHLVRFNKGVLQDEPVEFDSLRGKYVVICCFDVPMRSDSTIASNCRALIDAYIEFGNFELVVVANLRTDIVYDLKAAFYHFYSAFSCLAIPFSDFETRYYLRKCLRVCLDEGWPEFYLAMLVNPDGVILQNDMILHHFLSYACSELDPSFSPLYGIEKQDEALRSSLDPMYVPLPLPCNYSKSAIGTQKPLSLFGDILFCDPNAASISRFDGDTDTDDDDVGDLSSKYVGLYMFIDGNIIQHIKAAHDRCLANNQQLEIVVVPVPFFDEPESHIEQLLEVLRLFNINSWFIYYCDSMVSRRLCRVFGQECYRYEEEFIIIPPDCKSGELSGRQVINSLGVDKYPFTRTAILKQKLDYVRSLTLIFSSSLFNNCQMIQNGQEFNPEQLQGKNVLLHLSWSKSDPCSLLKKHYPEIKAMGWEVVFVLLHYKDRHWNQKWVGHESWPSKKWPRFNLEEMPWPYMRLSAAAGASFKTLFLPIDRKTDYLFAVGKDGKIVSRDVQYQLGSRGVTESLFDDVLEIDFGSVLARLEVYDRDEYL